MLHNPADPPLLFIKADAEVVYALAQYFALSTTHTSQDGIDALAFLVYDLGGQSNDPAKTAVMASTILTSCHETNPDPFAFAAWKDAHMLHDRKARFLRGHGEATPATWWPVAYGCWSLMPNNGRNAAEAALAAQTFRSRSIPIEVALLTVRAFLGQPREAQNVFVELLQHHALLADDLRSPADALAILGHPDFMETVDLWRQSGRRRRIRTVAGSLLRRKKRLSHDFKPKRDTAKVTPPIPVPVPMVRNVVVAPPSPPKVPAPTTLAEALQAHLPSQAKPVARGVADMLKVMKTECTPLTMTIIVHRMRCMLGNAQRVAERLVERAIRWLAERGVLDDCGGYRLRSSSNDEVGRQILALV